MRSRLLDLSRKGKKRGPALNETLYKCTTTDAHDYRSACSPILSRTMTRNNELCATIARVSISIINRYVNDSILTPVQYESDESNYNWPLKKYSDCCKISSESRDFDHLSSIS